MRWTAPPDRREITLVVVSLFAFFFAYNFDTSFELLGVDPAATQGAVLRRLGLGKKDIGADGRKQAGWRDRLEADIFGDWQWDKGHVAGHGRERSQPKGTGRHGATWIGKKAVAKIPEAQRPESTVDKALERWGNDIPLTEVIKHVPGYTILDNVYIANGTAYLIADSADSLPKVTAMVSTIGNGFARWLVLTPEEALKTIGTFGSIIRGVSWMAADSNPHNSTLFALWRTYSSLDPTIDSEGRTRLAPPHRLLFPHDRFFTDPNPDFDKYKLRRRRVDTGFHHYTAKIAFPQLDLQYFEDWDDLKKIALPFVFERLVIADRHASQHTVPAGHPAFSSAFGLETSPHWWEPIRKNLVQFLEQDLGSPKSKPVVTYIHAQEEHGLKLSDPDHQSLVNALKKMGKSRGYDIHVVAAQASGTGWSDKMTAIVKSSVVLGVHGGHMMDSVFMQPAPRSTVMEVFPTDKYAKDQELVAQSLGLKYTAWWGSRSFTSDYPTVALPKDEAVAIDVQAIVRSIQDVLS